MDSTFSGNSHFITKTFCEITNLLSTFGKSCLSVKLLQNLPNLLQYQRELMAKAAGIEIVTASELREKYEVDDEENFSEEDEDESAEYSDEDDDGAESEDGEYLTGSDEEHKAEGIVDDKNPSGKEDVVENVVSAWDVIW